jgi:hypothetical protein
MKVNPAHRQLFSSATKAKSVENIGGTASEPAESSQLPETARPAGASTAPAGAGDAPDTKAKGMTAGKPGAKAAPATSDATPSAESTAAIVVKGDLKPSSTPAKRLRKSKRPEKRADLKPDAKLNLNCTLERRDAIHKTAEALGMTATEYLLRCEQNALHQLVERFTTYIETLVQMHRDEFEARMVRLEEMITQSLPPK